LKIKMMTSDNNDKLLKEFFSKYIELNKEFLRDSNEQTVDVQDKNPECLEHDDVTEADLRKADQDSLIQSNEAKMKTMLQPLAEKAFDHYDLDQTGVLSVDESTTFFAHFAMGWKMLAHGNLRFVFAQMSDNTVEQSRKNSETQVEEVPYEGNIFSNTKKLSDICITITDEVIDEAFANYLANKVEFDQAAFAAFDVNGNGKLEREVVLRIMDVIAPKFDELLKAFGINVEEIEVKIQSKVKSFKDFFCENDGTKKFNDEYKLGDQLGEGVFSVVRECKENETGTSYAVKVVTKSQLTEEDKKVLFDEINILQELNNPNIIRLHQVVKESTYLYFVMERMCGGELFDRIVKKTYYNEKEARDVCYILFSALAYCHKNRITHRNVKPESLLLISETDDSSMKLSGFGFAKKAPTEHSLKTQCGTPSYVAPEILEDKPYGTQADMWSLGVTVYILLGGYPPFIEENQRVLFDKIRKGQYEFHEMYWEYVSSEAKDLISSLMDTNPDTRLTAERALQHPWMKSDDTYLKGKDLDVNLAELKKYQAKKKFKAAAQAVIFTGKLGSLGQNFKENM